MGIVWFSIDPGKSTGVGVFRGGDLLSGELLNNKTTGGRAVGYARALAEFRELVSVWTPALVVIELPQVYGQRKTDPNDLIHLAALAGQLAEAAYPAEVLWVLPAEWKGQINKKVMVGRVEASLSPEDRAKLKPCNGSLRHNLIDGVGVGQVGLGKVKGAPRTAYRGSLVGRVYRE